MKKPEEAAFVRMLLPVIPDGIAAGLLRVSGIGVGPRRSPTKPVLKGVGRLRFHQAGWLPAGPVVFLATVDRVLNGVAQVHQRLPLLEVGRHVPGVAVGALRFRQVIGPAALGCVLPLTITINCTCWLPFFHSKTCLPEATDSS